MFLSVRDLKSEFLPVLLASSRLSRRSSHSNPNFPARSAGDPNQPLFHLNGAVTDRGGWAGMIIEVKEQPRSCVCVFMPHACQHSAMPQLLIVLECDFTSAWKCACDHMQQVASCAMVNSVMFIASFLKVESSRSAVLVLRPNVMRLVPS